MVHARPSHSPWHLMIIFGALPVIFLTLPLPGGATISQAETGSSTAIDLPAVNGSSPFEPFLRLPETLEDLPLRTTALDSAGLDSVITESMELHHIPGLAACIVKDGEIAWKRTFGYADVQQGIAVADTTVFMLASISKTFVGIAVMQLWEQGLLGLDDDINDHLPFAVTNPFFTAIPITPRMLLAHTSSIAYNAEVWLPLITWGADSPIGLGEFLESYLVPGGTYYRNSNYNVVVPGHGSQYSNIAYALAGYLVEVISGQSFEEYCQSAIFAPLGMHETSWFLAGLNPDNIAMPTQYFGGVFTPYGQYGFPVYPAGQLRTSSLQLARHLIAFMQLGQIDGTRILESSTVELMTTIQYPDVPPVFPGYDWGLGWFRIPYGGGWLWGHTGGIYGVATYMFYNPDENFGIIELTNTNATEGHSDILVALLEYASQLADETATYLTAFTAERQGLAARLTWQVLGAETAQGFHVWRQEGNQDPVRLTSVPIASGSASQGHISESTHNYEYWDPSAPLAGAEYRLQVLGADGSLNWLGIALLEPAAETMPEFVLSQNQPNPFNPTTTITFHLSLPTRATLAVFGLDGRLVATLLDEVRPAGSHRVVWDGRDMRGRPAASGAYFYRLQTENGGQTRKMILAK